MKAKIDFEKYFKSNYSRSYYLALSLVHDEEVSRDVVADVFAYLLTHKRDMDESELNSYLYVMIRNKCADHFRQAVTRDKYAEWVMHTFSVEADDWREHEQKVTAVIEALDDLTPRTREVFEAHYLNGMKYGEVARKLMISENAVKKHIVQGLKHLRKKFVKESEMLVLIFILITILF